MVAPRSFTGNDNKEKKPKAETQVDSGDVFIDFDKVAAQNKDEFKQQLESENQEDDINDQEEDNTDITGDKKGDKKKYEDMTEEEKEEFKQKHIRENIVSIGLDSDDVSCDASAFHWTANGVCWAMFNATGYFQIVFATIAITLIPTFVMSQRENAHMFILWTFIQFFTAVLGFINARCHRYQLLIPYVILCWLQIQHSISAAEEFACITGHCGKAERPTWVLTLLIAHIGNIIASGVALIAAAMGLAALLTSVEAMLKENSDTKEKKESTSESAEMEARAQITDEEQEAIMRKNEAALGLA